MTLVTGNTIADGDASADIVGTTATVTVTAGDFGVTGGGNNSIDTTVANLNVTTSAANGSQWIDTGAGTTDVNSVGLNAGSGNIHLFTTGTMTQSAVITAAGLELLGVNGTYTFNTQNNAITNLAGDTGTVRFQDNSGFAVGTVNTLGLTTSVLSRLESNGTVTQSQLISTPDLLLTGTSSVFTLTHGSNQISSNFASSSTGSVELVDLGGFAVNTVDGVAGVTAGSTMVLSSNGAVTNTQPIKVTSLGLMGAGQFTLDNNANAVTDFASSSTGLVTTFNEANGYAITTVNGLTLGAINGINAVANDVVLSTVTGLVTQTKGIIANELSLGGSANYTLDTENGTLDENNVDNLFGTVTGNVLFSDDTNLALGNVAGTTGLSVTGNLAVNADAAITQTAAATVTGTADFVVDVTGAGITLNTATNNIQGITTFNTLNGSDAGDVSFVNNTNILLGASTVDGTLTVSTNAAGQNMTVSGTLKSQGTAADNIDLNAHGTFTQDTVNDMLSVGNVLIDATTGVTVSGTIGAGIAIGGTVGINQTLLGTVDVDGTVKADGDVLNGLIGGGAVNITAAVTADANANGNVQTVLSNGAIVASATLTGGNVTMTSNMAAVTAAAVTATGAGAVDGDIAITGATNVTLNGTLTAGTTAVGDITVQATANALNQTAGNMLAGGNVNIDAGTGVTLSGTIGTGTAIGVNVNINTAFTATTTAIEGNVTADGAVNIGHVNSGVVDIGVAGATVTITSDNDAGAGVSGEDISVLSTTNITMANASNLVSNTGGILVSTGGGTIVVTGANSDGANQLVHGVANVALSSMNQAGPNTAAIVIHGQGNVTVYGIDSVNAANDAASNVDIQSISGNVLIGKSGSSTLAIDARSGATPDASTIFVEAALGNILDNNDATAGNNLQADTLNARALNQIGIVANDQVFFDPEDTQYALDAMADALETLIDTLVVQTLNGAAFTEVAIDNDNAATLTVNQVTLNVNNLDAAWIRNNGTINATAVPFVAGTQMAYISELGSVMLPGGAQSVGTGTGTGTVIKVEAATVGQDVTNIATVTADNFILKSGTTETVNTTVVNLDAAVFGATNDLQVTETDGLTVMNLDGDDDQLTFVTSGIGTVDASFYAADAATLINAGGDVTFEHASEAATGQLTIDLNGAGNLFTSTVTDTVFSAGTNIDIDVNDGNQLYGNGNGLTAQTVAGYIRMVNSVPLGARSITIGDGGGSDVAITANGIVANTNGSGVNGAGVIIAVPDVGNILLFNADATNPGAITIKSDATIYASNPGTLDELGTKNIFGEVTETGKGKVDSSRVLEYRAKAGNIVFSPGAQSFSGVLNLSPGANPASPGNFFDVIMDTNAHIVINAAPAPAGPDGDLNVTNAQNFTMSGTASIVAGGSISIDLTAGVTDGTATLRDITIDANGDGNPTGGGGANNESQLIVTAGAIILQGHIDANSNLGAAATSNDVTLTAVTTITDENTSGTSIDHVEVLTLGTTDMTGIQHYIGSAPQLPSAYRPIRVNAVDITATHAGRGQIAIDNNPGATVTINGLTNGAPGTAAANEIFYSQGGQNLNVAGPITSLGGDITIDPPVDVTVNAVISSALIGGTGGTVLIEATNDITIAAGGRIESDGGDIQITADQDLSGAGTVTFVAGAGANIMSKVYSGDADSATVGA
ncbi:MAG: hypothetical protein JKX85_03960, partial [Phycisphaeraceae bacterium]|nr:hypothetical protein [Phycisphaeraceae bacterium]